MNAMIRLLLLVVVGCTSAITEPIIEPIPTPDLPDAQQLADAGHDDRLPIIVIAGQSNAAGRGSVEMITDFEVRGFHLPYTAVRYFDKVEDHPTIPLQWDFDRGPIDLQPLPGGNRGVCGIELALGRRLVETYGYAHAQVKIAIGSSTLQTHWRANGSTYPSGDDPLSDQMIVQAHVAEDVLGGRVVGVIWIQGESDAGIGTAANDYADNQEALIVKWRAEFPDTWWYINQLHANAGGTFNATVRMQQAILVARTPNTRLVDVDDLSLVGAHFTADSYVELGYRFADEIVE
jgi:hypothetical protein